MYILPCQLLVGTTDTYAQSLSALPAATHQLTCIYRMHTLGCYYGYIPEESIPLLLSPGSDRKGVSKEDQGLQS